MPLGPRCWTGKALLQLVLSMYTGWRIWAGPSPALFLVSTWHTSAGLPAPLHEVHDHAGIVMLMIDTRMEPAIAKNMVQGAPDTLHSEFRLSYAMLLNLLLSEAADPESLLRASFRQFQVERSLPALTQRIAQLEVSNASPA